MFSCEPRSGKVRDIFELGDYRLLLVATDRISAFDVVAAEPIPEKGRVLTKLSLFWFGKLAGVVKNHFLSTDLRELPVEFQSQQNVLKGRSMIVRRADVLPIEAVVRGYLAGSGWKEYQHAQAVCGVELPVGLRESDQLPFPILTPATKAVGGFHDENITAARAMEIVGEETYLQVERASLTLYGQAAEYARQQGIIIADTKFEFGLTDGRLVLVDEVLTPDSSRFWPVEGYEPGRVQVSFDKQPVRDYLEQSGWNKQSPMPPLPAEVVSATTVRYQEALRLITGSV